MNHLVSYLFSQLVSYFGEIHRQVGTFAFGSKLYLYPKAYHIALLLYQIHGSLRLMPWGSPNSCACMLQQLFFEHCHTAHSGGGWGAAEPVSRALLWVVLDSMLLLLVCFAPLQWRHCFSATAAGAADGWCL